MTRHGSGGPAGSAGVGRILVVLLTALAIAVAGCSGSGGGQGASEKQSIRFAWWGDTDRLATTKRVLAAFQQQHPNVTVEMETSADTDSYFDKLATEMAAGDAPDVMTLGGAYPREFSDRGALLDLSTVSDQLDLSKFPASTLAASKFNGKQYGVPTGGNAIGLIINTKIFERAGVPLPDTDTWTWEDFVTTAGEITAKSPKGTYGFEPRIVDTIGVYAQQRGSAVYNAEGQLGVSADTLADYWRMEQALLKNKGAPTASKIQELLNASPEQTLMGQGKAAMTIGYSNLLGTYAAASAGDLKLATVPGATEYIYAGPTILPSQYYAIPTKTKHQQAAAQLLSFLVNSPTAGNLIKDDRGMPFQTDVRKVVSAKLDAYGKANAAYLDVVAKNGTPTAPIPPAGGSALNDTVNKLDSDVLFGRTTPDAAAKDCLQQLQEALDHT